ncbi:MAG: phenylacetate-CoA oxygenase subunit PaaC [Bacteroidetes bacterium]|nr:phenylacetate-CoA oxygenase subunit PaaC [Bacteroidota bacterium]
MNKNSEINTNNKNTFLTDYCLHLADNSLILAQRNSAWCGHGPILEQDIAITNISLDILGQARNFYQYTAEILNSSKNNSSAAVTEVTEDSLAFLRDNREFKNCLLVEQENGDWGKTILRQFLFSNYQYLLYLQLQNSADEKLAAIATKAIKEVTYHLKWSSEWVIRLGDGTEESHQRITQSIHELWPFTEEIFINAKYENELTEDKIAVDVSVLKDAWYKKTAAIFAEATLTIPENVFAQKGGKHGAHTEKLGYILAEMQFMQRAYPGCIW